MAWARWDCAVHEPYEYDLSHYRPYHSRTPDFPIDVQPWFPSSLLQLYGSQHQDPSISTISVVLTSTPSELMGSEDAAAPFTKAAFDLVVVYDQLPDWMIAGMVRVLILEPSCENDGLRRSSTLMELS